MASRPVSQRATRLQQILHVRDCLNALKFPIIELPSELILDSHHKANHGDRIPTRDIAKRHGLGKPGGWPVQNAGNEVLSL